MISGAHDGTLKFWNFSSGECLKQCVNPDATELTAVCHVINGASRHVLAVGWGRALSMWADDDAEQRVVVNLQPQTRGGAPAG